MVSINNFTVCKISSTIIIAAEYIPNDVSSSIIDCHIFLIMCRNVFGLNMVNTEFSWTLISPTISRATELRRAGFSRENIKSCGNLSSSS